MAAALLLLTLLSAGRSGPSDPPARPVEGEHFVYHVSDPGYMEVATRTLEEVRGRLSRLLGDSLPYKPAIHVVDEQQYFDELIGGKFPDWGAGAAVSQRRLIAVKSPRNFNLSRSLAELLAHEYAHLVTAHKTGLRSSPRWFDEGLAMYVSMEWGWSDNLAMSKAAVFGQFLDLGEIENVNRFQEGKAHLAYAQAYLAVAFMVDNYSERSLGVFLEEIGAGKTESEALYQATGSTREEFASDFKLHLNRRFNVVSLFMDTIFFWLGLALIAVVAAFLRFRRRRQYYREWEKQERLHSTDFDYGDPERPEEIPDDDEPWRA
ncbi:MAG: hypothetical protein JSW34_04230 [Candidatus Zixiibacteriota bacterium]|nr:MAG: hypothetical protein JSW34_04230 [candidate division Zixibacteria bacterium]